MSQRVPFQDSLEGRAFLDQSITVLSPQRGVLLAPRLERGVDRFHLAQRFHADGLMLRDFGDLVDGQQAQEGVRPACEGSLGDSHDLIKPMGLFSRIPGKLGGELQFETETVECGHRDIHAIVSSPGTPEVDYASRLEPSFPESVEDCRDSAYIFGF